MRKGIKKSYLIINIILALFACVLLFNIFVTKNTNFFFCGISTSIIFILMYLLYGYERKAKRFKQETIFYITAYTIIFVIATYIIGVFSGFSRSPFIFNFKGIVNNILPYLLIIASGEFLRSEVTRKCEGSTISYAMCVIVLTLIDCTIYLTTFDLGTGDGQVEFICNILLPSVSKNIFLMYISLIGGLIPTIIYRLLMELKIFIIPIIPDFGLYIDSVVQTVIPGIIGIIIYISLKQFQNKEVQGKTYKQGLLYTYASTIILTMVIVLIVGLTSCRFKYGAIAIGSGSMTGTINKGDVVVFKQIGDYKPSVDEIIVFRKDGKLIVHRIIEVVQVNDDEFIYYTKGDANPTPDGYPLTQGDLVGLVNAKVKYIGIPSVYLHELLTKK